MITKEEAIRIHQENAAVHAHWAQYYRDAPVPKGYEQVKDAIRHAEAAAFSSKNARVLLGIEQE